MGTTLDLRDRYGDSPRRAAARRGHRHRPVHRDRAHRRRTADPRRHHRSPRLAHRPHPRNLAAPGDRRQPHSGPVELLLTTTGRLDDLPDDEQPAAALAAYTCLRAGHPINPAAGPTPATAADLDHHQAKSAGGKTQRTNLGPLARRWHRLKTFDHWTVTQTPNGWHWTSPTGRTYEIEPFDYRLGP